MLEMVLSMVDKRKEKSLGEMTAYERWELPNIASDGTMQSVVTDSVEKVKPLTADDIENIRQQAYKDGFEEGRSAGIDSGYKDGRSTGHEEGVNIGKQEGHAQGLQAAQVEIEAQKQKLSQLISQIHSPLQAQSELIEEVMLNVVIALSRSVIHQELSMQKGAIKAAVISVIDSLPDLDDGAVLSVSPGDLACVNEVVQSLKKSFEVSVDDSLTAGGFKLKTASQLIDYTIEKRFQKAVQSMLSQSLAGGSGEQEIPSTINALSDYPAETLSSNDMSQGEVSPGGAEESVEASGLMSNDTVPSGDAKSRENSSSDTSDEGGVIAESIGGSDVQDFQEQDSETKDSE